MQDWRVGRLIRSVPIQGLVSIDLVIPPSQQRVGILFGTGFDVGPVVDEVSVIITATGYPQIVVAEVAMPYMMSIMTHGDLPTKQFTVSSQSSAVAVYAIAFMMPEEYLAAGLEQFISEYERWKR